MSVNTAGNKSTNQETSFSHSFDNKAVVGSWEKADRILDGEANIVALESKKSINEGDFAYVEENPGVQGVYLDTEVVSIDEIKESERMPGGFFTKNCQGETVETKYRFPDELRGYPETVHVHNVDELYVPFGGSFDMMVSEERMPMEFTEITVDEPTVIPSGMYHGINQRQGEAGLVIVRGDPQGNEKTVGKWNLNGNQMYEHAENLDFPLLNQYSHQTDYTL